MDKVAPEVELRLFSLHHEMQPSTFSSALLLLFCAQARASGQDDLSDVLLALTTELSSSFNFFDTFTDPFEVSNKVIFGKT